MRIAPLDLHNYLRGLNHLYLYGDITREAIAQLEIQIEKLNEPFAIDHYDYQIISQANPILLHINSFGGELSAGLTGIRLLKSSTIPIYTIIDGVAMSAAATIFAAGQVRYGFDSSILMIHQHWENVMGKFRHEDVVSNSDLSKALYEQYKKFYLQNSKLKSEELDSLLAHDRFLTAEESRRAGIVDYIVPSLPMSTIKNIARANYEKVNPLHLKQVVKPQSDYTHTRKNQLFTTLTIPSDMSFSKNPCVISFQIVNAIHSINVISMTTVMLPNKNFMQSYSGVARPIRLLIPEVPFGLSDINAFFAILPIINAIKTSSVPIVSLIDGNCNKMSVLLSLVCHERWVYRYSVLDFDFRYMQDKGDKIIDTAVNTKKLQSFIFKLFKTRTKLKEQQLKQLFQSPFVFTADTAVQHGLVDGIFDDSQIGNSHIANERSIITK